MKSAFKGFPAMAAALVALLAFCGAAWATGDGFTRIKPQEADRLLKNGSVDLLLDVRTMEYFTGPNGRLNGALLIPVSDLSQKMDFLNKYRDKTVLVYCEVGIWSQDAARFLAGKGFKHILELGGGIVEWRKAGLPVIH